LTVFKIFLRRRMMSKITNDAQVNMQATIETEAVKATARKTKIRVAVAGALSPQSAADMPPIKNYALAEVNMPALTPVQQLDRRIRQLGLDSSTSLELLKNYLAAETRVTLEYKLSTVTKVLDEATEALKGAPTLKEIVVQFQAAFAAIDKEVETGAMSYAHAAVQIANLSDSAEAAMAKVNDQYVNDLLLAKYNKGQLSDKEAIQAVNVQFNQVAVDATRKVSTEKLTVAEQIAQLQKELDAISNSGTLDITALLIKLMTAMDQLRVLANKAKAREREATLTLQLRSADTIKEKGSAQLTQALVSGITGIVAGAVTVFGTMYAVSKGNTAQKDAVEPIKAEALLANKSLEDPEIATSMREAGSKAFSQQFNIYNSYASGMSQVTKGGGDAGSGGISFQISNIEADGKEQDAYAQAASGRADAAAKMSEDLYQGIMKMLENLMQINNIINQGISNIIQKV
jgi:hypothetical protein